MNQMQKIRDNLRRRRRLWIVLALAGAAALAWQGARRAARSGAHLDVRGQKPFAPGLKACDVFRHAVDGEASPAVTSRRVAVAGLAFAAVRAGDDGYLRLGHGLAGAPARRKV